jgi:hypothetical protein
MQPFQEQKERGGKDKELPIVVFSFDFYRM